MTDPLFDGGAGDPELTALEDQLRVFAHTAPLREPPPRRRSRRWLWPSAAVLVAAIVVSIVWFRRGGGDSCAGTTGFTFALTSGTATCGDHTVAQGTLPVGAWLETHRDSAATVKVADIGELTVFGDSKLRLVGTGAAQHRLELARGHISAHVTAPPRLFVVDTPAAAAVDLGCAYDLVVDDAGRTHLRVTRGAVSLEDARGVAYVPATFEVDVVPGRLGTPIWIEATAEMRAAVARFDAGDANALANVVALAGMGDRVTLWNIIGRTHDAGAVRALEALAPLPDPALHANVLAGDADALDIWLDVFVDRGSLAHGKR